MHRLTALHREVLSEGPLLSGVRWVFYTGMKSAPGALHSKGGRLYHFLAVSLHGSEFVAFALEFLCQNHTTNAVRT